MSHYAVIGGTGTVGSQIVGELWAAGEMLGFVVLVGLAAGSIWLSVRSRRPVRPI